MLRIFLLTFSLTIAAAPRAGAGEIRLRPECRPEGSLVKLGEVSEIQIADDLLAKKLAALVLFPVPGAGQRRFLRTAEVQEILELRSVDPADCRVTGAKLVVIHGPQQKKPPATPATPAAPSANGAAPAKAEAVVFAVAAARLLERGQMIQPDDVQLASFPASAAQDDLLHEVELAVGQEATRQFAAGQPIESRGLRKPILVRRRDTVRVAVIAPGVRLAIDAVAHEEGSEGDWVLIEIPLSPEKVRARVSGPKQVEIYAAGAQPQH